jgi:hypothetical protein
VADADRRFKDVRAILHAHALQRFPHRSYYRRGSEMSVGSGGARSRVFLVREQVFYFGIRFAPIRGT